MPTLKDRERALFLGVAGVALLMLVWELIVRVFAIPVYVLPPMSGILATVAENGSILAAAALTTVLEVVAGLTLGAVIGVAIAIALVMVPFAKNVVLPPLVAINSVPSVAYAPLAQLWFGVGPEGKVFMEAIATGLRISVVRSMIIAIVTEMLGAYRGLGWVIFQSAQQVDFLGVWSAVLVTSLTSLALFALVSAGERRLVFWR